MNGPEEQEDKLPPHSIEAEQGVLGCILLSPKDCLLECVERLRPGFLSFYDLRHQTLFKSLASMAKRSEVDLITVVSELKTTGLMQESGGLAYVSSLPDAVPSAANLEYYLDIVLEKYMLRKLIQTCAGISQRAFDGESEPGELVDGIEKEILAIRASIERGRGIADLAKVGQQLIGRYEASMEGKQTGVLTGFPDLDQLTGGMQRQETIILAGQQSTGKTSLLLNILWRVVERGGVGGILSLETSAEKLLHRLYCLVARINGAQFLNGGYPTQRECAAMLEAAAKVQNVRQRILIDDSGGLTVAEMKAKARRMYQAGADFVGLDYMQLVHSPGAKSDVERMTAISMGVKECAKENDRPFIGVSSLNREAAKGDRKPRMCDLRGSGQIEYDANQAWLLECEDAEAMTRTVKINVAKNKDGGTGTRDLLFFPAEFRFESAAKVQL